MLADRQKHFYLKKKKTLSYISTIPNLSRQRMEQKNNFDSFQFRRKAKKILLQSDFHSNRSGFQQKHTSSPRQGKKKVNYRRKFLFRLVLLFFCLFRNPSLMHICAEFSCPGQSSLFHVLSQDHISLCLRSTTPLTMHWIFHALYL